MLPTRKIGALLRGKATPFQLFTGCLLGALIGFLPGWSAAPGLTVALSLVLIMLNANLFLAAVVGLLAKLLSLAALPVSFAVGQFLLDGPPQPLFRALINAPVFALFGFDNYTATGGLVLGGLFGLITGTLVARGLTTFRQRMVSAGQNSEKFKTLNARPWVRWSVFVLAGGGLKEPDYAALLQKKIGNPIRPLGAILAVLTLILGIVGFRFFAPGIVTTALRDGLERANGATVDLESAEIDLSAGRMVITGLAAADPNALKTNLFSASRIEADVNGVDLLRKRLRLDRVIISGARLGEARTLPGKIIVAPPETEGPGLTFPDAGTLDDYLANAQVWRERLAQVKSWLDRLGSEPAPADPSAPGTGPAETLQQRLERLAAENGYASVYADHLVDGAPTFMVSDMQANEVRAEWLPGETLNFHATNLSTQPRLVPEPAGIEITSSGHTLAASVLVSELTAVKAHYRGLPAATVSAALKREGDTGKPLLDGGTVDLGLDGTYSLADGSINAPLEVTLHHTVLQIAGKPLKLSNFTLPVGLAGSLTSPRIKIDQNQLGRLAKQAGTELLKDKAKDALGDKASGLLNLLGGKKP